MDFLIFKAPMLMVQASLDGILLGILFALIAYGMALQWGVMNIINIAQGDLVILGGYIAYKTLITAENIFELGSVTELSNNIVVPYSDCATTTSAPNIKFINC